jgi:hypothetical protein
MTRRLALGSTVAAMALTSMATAAEAPLTLEVRANETPGGGGIHLFAGMLANGRAGELVTVLAKVCPRNSEYAVAGAQTEAGGAWRAEKVGVLSTATFRARWEGRFSEPVKVYVPIYFRVESTAKGRVLVVVDTMHSQQDLTRRFVQLQRFDSATGRWRLYKRARLKRNLKVAAFNFTATFTRVERGLTLRVLVPRKTAAPCYQARAGETFRT